MLVHDRREDEHDVPVHGVTPGTLDAVVATLPRVAAGYAAASGYKAEPGEVFLAPDETGALAGVLLGVGQGPAKDRFIAGKLARLLPEGTYALASGFDDPFLAALAFELGGYEFARFRRKPDGRKGSARLRAPAGVEPERVALIADAIALGRDLINRPASDLGPAALEAAARTSPPPTVPRWRRSAATTSSPATCR